MEGMASIVTRIEDLDTLDERDIGQADNWEHGMLVATWMELLQQSTGRGGNSLDLLLTCTFPHLGV
jgi:hypothetical protein